MNEILNYLVIALALSMDAFSIVSVLAFNKLLTIGKSLFFTLLVGLLHFIMPFLGSLIGNNIAYNLDTISKYILAFIFLILGIEILFSKDKKIKEINYLSLIIIAISVSIDSFTIGLGLSINNEYNLFASFIFSIISLLFTFLGIVLSNLINKKIKFDTNKIGAIILFVLSLKYLFY